VVPPLALLAGILIVWQAAAAGGYSALPDPGPGNRGLYTSIALDGSGNPIVAYYDLTNGNLKVLHCADPTCLDPGSSVSAPDTTGTVGLYTSTALDSAGNPVVSYYDQSNGDLKVMHCNDPGCTAGDESIASPDTAGNVGRYTSIVLDASGHPFVAYYDVTNANLKVVHCNDENCSGGGEIINTPDTQGDVGKYASIKLAPNGWPKIAYYDATAKNLHIVNCYDVDCNDQNDLIITPDMNPVDSGLGISLAIDASGKPVMAYYEGTNGALRLVRCNDTICTNNDESISVVDSSGEVGHYPSLVLDGVGNPVITYYQASGSDLKVAHCNDPNCTGGDESIASPHTLGDAGEYPSLTIGADGYPVVSYYDATNQTLRVLRCAGAGCAGVKEVGGLTELPGVTAARQASGAWILTLLAGAVLLVSSVAVLGRGPRVSD
jgi:hypothetical protein